MEYADLFKAREECGTSSLMVARKALNKPSIFRAGGLVSMNEEISNILHQACLYDEPYTQTKYCVQRILGSQQVCYPCRSRILFRSLILEARKHWRL